MGDDKLGPTGNTYSPCGWCGTAHHPIAACGHEGLRETIAILSVEVAKLKALLHRWMAAYPATHSVTDGNPLPWMQDTLKELGMPLLNPVRSEEE